MEKKILYYLNQFFGQIGGEEQAHYAPTLTEGAVGPAMKFQQDVGDAGKVVATLICGDNYFNENNEEALSFLKKAIEDIKPDLVVAGPAFNAGRYGMACAGVAEYASKEHGLPVVSGMFEENPGLTVSRAFAYVVPTGAAAGDIRKALPAMAKVARKVLLEEELKPEADGYFSQGKRDTVLVEDIGAKRAVDMLLKRLNNQEFKTELPMPEFDTVDPAPAIKDLSKAVIAIVTTGGIVPEGNPDRIQSASAQKWGKYDVSHLNELKGDFITIHGGYDPVYANESPDRVAPLDVLKQMEKNGEIGKVYDFFYTTTGTGTAVGNSITFGKEIGAELRENGVDGVILTST